MSKENWKPETLAIHGGYTADTTRAITMPIYQTTAYKFETAEQGANLFDLKEAGNIYTRINNPTFDTLGEKINRLEGGVGALVTSSGQAATTLAILNICTCGDHFIASQNIYGGTHALFLNTFPKMGIEVTLVDPDLSLAELNKYVKDNTKLIFSEVIGNPRNSVIDIEKFASLAHDHQIPLIIDNTYLTPYLFKPFDYGADIVIHSATKYLGGHGNALAGVIVDSGRFDWNNGNFTELTTPDSSYHGIVYTEAFGNAAYIVKARTQLIRDLGCTLSPFNAFLIHNGIETLHLRMERHSSNALALSQWLAEHPKVEWVSYPLLEQHQDYQLAKKYFTKGASGMVAFAIKGGLTEGEKVIEAFQLATHATNLGDVRTIVSHPASTTHRQLSAEEQAKGGISPNFIRVAVGIESIDDIITDFDQALNSF